MPFSQQQHFQKDRKRPPKGDKLPADLERALATFVLGDMGFEDESEAGATYSCLVKAISSYLLPHNEETCSLLIDNL